MRAGAQAGTQAGAKKSAFEKLKRVALALLAVGALSAEAKAPKTVREFRVFAVEIGGTKFWLPSTLIVDRGDLVRIRLLSKVPAPAQSHGYSIPDYEIAVLADDQKETIVEFEAKKKGIFPIGCHLHPAHIGGQLLVR
jgi:hypothetical protein